MTTIPVKGIRITKDGKIVKDQRRLSVSAKIRQSKSKAVKPARKQGLVRKS